jgi:hypothetical protein
LNAVTAVLDRDMPNEIYSEAVNAQVCHLTGLDREDDWDGWDSYGIDTPAH